MLGFLLLFFTHASMQDIRIAAASDLQFALEDVVTEFEKETGFKALVSFGSSGNLYSQLEQGAPFDLFFSASSTYTQKLEASGLIEAHSRKLYAIGRLVLWAHQQLGLNPEDLKEQLLLSTEVKHIAIANPDHAPYGQAATDLLERAELYEQIKDKLIYGENVSQAAQLALSSGNVGILALSLALNPAMKESGAYWLIPLEHHMRLEQEMVILKNQNRPEVQAFFTFMQSSVARDILKSYGLVLP
jgi:molybdate transport system substrate-binding protein